MTSRPTETDLQIPSATVPVPVLKQVLPLPEGFSLLSGSTLSAWVVDHEVLIGREADANAGIRLADDAKASKQHARLRPSAGALELVDLGSKNHTYVNGQQVSKELLRDGSVVRVGNSLFVLRWERPSVVDAPRADKPLHERLLGRSQEVRSLRHSLSVAARSGEPVLLTGPTGTGKELGAAAIHALSSRSSRPLVAVNCAAIPHGAAESALFGHRRGAFTGAERDHDGYFKQADGATLLLDEVGELPLEIQAKLLRTLQPAHSGPAMPPNRNLLRVQSYGGQSEFQVDVRIIAATHDLRRAVSEGKFREDLLQRLSVLPVRFPALSTRREDILPLVQHYLNLANPADRPHRLSARLGELLLLYPWPGNVRELENLCKRLRSLLPSAAVIDLTDLPEDLLEQLSAPSSPRTEVPTDDSTDPDGEEQPITQDLLVRLLSEHDGKISVVAKLLGRSARQVRRRMDEFGIFRPFARGGISTKPAQKPPPSSEPERNDE